ncbi:MAG: T9SS type A sorting domain-containing protein, partial [Ignavibacteriae bacterium]|nr:T9SS type A sorting domain-containing protein [Ignavibacteriota bacterium]
ISGSGTLIPPSQFFLPSSAGSRAEAGDDGTAGPFDIGGPMEFNGNTVRYAWIGVNGAIALTASESDTQHLNSNGYFNGLWTIPSGAQHNIPKNFIAAYWANHQFAQDSPFIQCGRILYRNGEDTCQFVVEWDSLGLLKTLGPDCGETTFRIILNRCDGTIEFQYDNVGTIGLDSSALVGIEADSTGPRPGGWIFVNKNGYPTETRPRNNWCMKIYQAIPVVIRDGWNIVSVPVIPPNMNYSRSLLFPSSISPCFHYRSDDPGELTRGEGCWLKFRGDQIVGIPGIPIHSLDIPLFDKWNMIGSISKPVPVGSLSFTEATMSSIGFFGFDGGVGYYLEDTIVPGKGYWVKINATGQNPLLHMSAAATPQKFDNPVSSELMQMSKLIVVDNAGYKQTLYFGDNGQVKSPINIFELPPPAPVGMDVRFASGRMLEVIDGKEAQEFPILISSAAYPLTISWELKNQAVQAWLCLDKSTVLLRDYGSIKIANPQSQISLRLEGSSEIPLTFALDQNYPNPFNPRTDIRLQIADHSHVVLKVFNVLGQEVATLVNEKKAPGEYTVTWDANNKPSGVYFYRLQTEKFIAVKKMLLIQ